MAASAGTWGASDDARLADWAPWQALRHFNALHSPHFRAKGDDGVEGPVDRVLPVERLGGAPLWIITTCERAGSCAALVTELGQAAHKAGIDPVLIVIRDTGPSDYAPLRDVLSRDFKDRSLLIETAHHFGKHAFWKIHQLIFDLERVLKPPHVLFAQDDVEPAAGWLDASWSMVGALDDPHLAALSLFSVDDDEADGRWIRFQRRLLPKVGVHLTQWFDLQMYLAMPRFFDALDHRVRPVHPVRWLFNPVKSSGVGAQLTRRLFRAEANVYQVDKTLAFHGREPSLMNPEARIVRPLDNRPRPPAL